MIFNFLEQNKIHSLNIYTNEEKEVFRELKSHLNLSSLSFFELKELFSADKKRLSEVEANLVWVTDREECQLERVFSKLREFREIYSVFSLCRLDLEKEMIKDLSLFSFFCYDPEEYFEEFGTVFFAFKRGLKLSPVYLGSGASDLDIGTDSSKKPLGLSDLRLQELPHSLEFGTQNLVSLIALATAFRELLQ